MEREGNGTFFDVLNFCTHIINNSQKLVSQNVSALHSQLRGGVRLKKITQRIVLITIEPVYKCKSLPHMVVAVICGKHY